MAHLWGNTDAIAEYKLFGLIASVSGTKRSERLLPYYGQEARVTG